MCCSFMKLGRLAALCPSEHQDHLERGLLLHGCKEWYAAPLWHCQATFSQAQFRTTILQLPSSQAWGSRGSSSDPNPSVRDLGFTCWPMQLHTCFRAYWTSRPLLLLPQDSPFPARQKNIRKLLPYEEVERLKLSTLTGQISLHHSLAPSVDA